MSNPKYCDHCGGDIAIRNPTGKCDHLYYPNCCPVCLASFKRKNPSPLESENAALKQENEEQARLLGISGTIEASLSAGYDRVRKERDRYKAAIEREIEMNDHGRSCGYNSMLACDCHIARMKALSESTNPSEVK